eukprot:6522311-Pyramimonas_sp.AAC.1
MASALPLTFFSATLPGSASTSQQKQRVFPPRPRRTWAPGVDVENMQSCWMTSSEPSCGCFQPTQ